MHILAKKIDGQFYRLWEPITDEKFQRYVVPKPVPKDCVVYHEQTGSWEKVMRLPILGLKVWEGSSFPTKFAKIYDLYECPERVAPIINNGKKMTRKNAKACTRLRFDEQGFFDLRGYKVSGVIYRGADEKLYFESVKELDQLIIQGDTVRYRIEHVKGWQTFTDQFQVINHTPRFDDYWVKYNPSKPSDPQQHLEYKWEHLHVYPKINVDDRYMTMENAKALADKIAEDWDHVFQGKRIRLEVNNRRTAWNVSCGGWIEFTKSNARLGINRKVLIHEMAHEILWALNGHRFENHGEEFVTTAMLLYTEYLGIPLGELQESADKMGLKYHTYFFPDVDWKEQLGWE